MKRVFRVLTFTAVVFGGLLQFHKHFYPGSRERQIESESGTDWRELNRKLLAAYGRETLDKEGVDYTAIDSDVLPTDAQNRNQYLFAVHRDTSHAHLHIAVNRVHPDTLRSVYPDRDFFHLDRAMRELELQYGWKHDKGPYAVFERDGKTVIDWSSQAPDTKGKRPTRASDMERHADAESLF